MLRLLLFGYGNPGRGDDVLGPDLVGYIEEQNLGGITCQQDMQLQIEHVTDMADCDRILFIDADASCAEPWVFSVISAEKDDSYTSHAMSPVALLYAYRQVYGKNAPAAFLLRIRGYDFELGSPLSVQAAFNLSAAKNLVHGLCVDRSQRNWLQHLDRSIHGG